MDQGGPAVRRDRHTRGLAHTKVIDLRPYIEAGPVLYDKSGSMVNICADKDRISAVHEYLIRGFDVVASVIVLLVMLPVMIVLAILIKLTSLGDILFKQDRVGKNGRIFTLYKFRSMIQDAERHTGPVLARPDDSRITPIGRFMRRTRLDELPQLFNVIRGDMSLVGPRPERPFFVRRHKALQGVRLSVRPGITGLAQVRGCYHTRPEHKLRYDYLYIRKRSLWLNLAIILRTIPVVIRGSGC